MADLTRLASWLRCPVCSHDLEQVDRLTLGCDAGHRHDVNKRGYVSLLGGGSKFLGDTADMLDARDAVLERGTYSPIADSLVAAAAPAADARILDAGAGTGYYLRALLAAAPGAAALALDLSPAAVTRAVRSSPHIDGLVADTWRPLPVRSGGVDLVVDVFAPRNLAEFHRVLRPGGTLVVVVPRADHLASLRQEGTMLDIPADKSDDVSAAATPLFAPLARERVTYALPVDEALRRALTAMGPSARHADAAPAEVAETTVSVDVLSFAAR
ncbi:methyltransferase domain-containing protein [Leifsonia shinshuensis]|uniref:methyltransferase domain-containing protein n=1 Tax=Leifsonia shinshuensis TaxID=150026 RepID=UPI001F50D850|nr:methyltransferase domain-containing protein [Leifsonia shinshuensis]MCI0155843.1 methyltransferase domain-containing protein [Leifsonia shinshuensis]